MKIIPDKTLFLLDADGTITDLQQKVITQPQIVEQLVKFLNLGAVVAIVTGRSIAWIDRVILSKILPKLTLSVQERVFVVAEFGAVWKTFPNEEEFVDRKYMIPVKICKKVAEFAPIYVRSLFMDTEKKCMVTFEMLDNYSFSDFKKDRDQLADKIREKLVNQNISKEICLYPSSIALDVRNVNLNKTTATNKVFEWLKNKEFELIEAISAGDNPFDAEMAKVAANNKLNSTFVYLGETKIEADSDYQILKPLEKFSTGLASFLRNLVY